MMALSSPAGVALESFAVAGRNRLDQGNVLSGPVEAAAGQVRHEPTEVE
jgi:hypothetical protein